MLRVHDRVHLHQHAEEERPVAQGPLESPQHFHLVALDVHLDEVGRRPIRKETVQADDGDLDRFRVAGMAGDRQAVQVGPSGDAKGGGAVVIGYRAGVHAHPVVPSVEPDVVAEQAQVPRVGFHGEHVSAVPHDRRHRECLVPDIGADIENRHSFRDFPLQQGHERLFPLAFSQEPAGDAGEKGIEIEREVLEPLADLHGAATIPRYRPAGKPGLP